MILYEILKGLLSAMTISIRNLSLYCANVECLTRIGMVDFCFAFLVWNIVFGWYAIVTVCYSRIDYSDSVCVYLIVSAIWVGGWLSGTRLSSWRWKHILLSKTTKQISNQHCSSKRQWRKLVHSRLTVDLNILIPLEVNCRVFSTFVLT